MTLLDHGQLPNPRRATVADLDQLWAVRTEAIRRGCSTHYAAATLDAWASVPRPPGFVDAVRSLEFLVVEENGAIRGFGFLNPGTEEIEGIFVAPEAHRRGIGRSLLEALEERAKTLGLPRLHLNSTLNAESFYLSMGFVAVRRTVWDHPNGFKLACVVMEKRLAPNVTR